MASLNMLLNGFGIIFIAVQLSFAVSAESNFTISNSSEIILMNNENSINSESNGVETISGWMLTIFIVSGVVITFWSLCIFGITMFLLKLYYQRRKKEILLRNKNYKNNDIMDDETIEMNINTLNIYNEDDSENMDETETEKSEQDKGDEGVYRNDKKHKKDKTYKIRYGDNNAYYPDDHNKSKADIKKLRELMYNYHNGISNDTAYTLSKDSVSVGTMNTSKIIQQTDGMEIGHLAVSIHCEDEESRASDDDIYDNPNSNKLLKRKYNKLNGKRKQIGFNGEERDGDHIYIHEQNINMEESYDDDHDLNLSTFTISNHGKGHNHKIMSDHYIYPSLPSFPDIGGHHIHVPSYQSGIPSSSFSAMYENCVTPDGFIFVGTNKTFGNQQYQQITETPTYQLPKYSVTKGQWM